MTSKCLQLKLLIVLALTIASSGWLMLCDAASISQIGDVEIYSNETHFKCDRIYCPAEAQRCQVTKEKQENNSTLVRKNICYGQNDQVIQQEIFTETVDPKAIISLNMNSFRNGFSSSIHSAIISNGIVSNNGIVSSEEAQKQLDYHFANAQRLNEEIHQQVAQINKNIQEQVANTLANVFANIPKY